jgi:hypothetical protein
LKLNDHLTGLDLGIHGEYLAPQTEAHAGYGDGGYQAHKDDRHFGRSRRYQQRTSYFSSKEWHIIIPTYIVTRPTKILSPKTV